MNKGIVIDTIIPCSLLILHISTGRTVHIGDRKDEIATPEGGPPSRLMMFYWRNVTARRKVSAR